jgi:hypothetical protein
LNGVEETAWWPVISACHHVRFVPNSPLPTPPTFKDYEEFFMIFSWIGHVPVLICHPDAQGNPQRGSRR